MGQDGKKDDPDGNPFFFRKGPQRTGRQNLTHTDVGNQARVLMTHFIADRIRQDGMEEIPEAESLIEPGTPAGPPVERLQQVARSLRQIGDELDQDENLRRLIRSIPPKSPRQTFTDVTTALFADGVFNWGRVVALFYFAYKMILKSIKEHIGDLPLLRSIVEFITEFITNHVASWIISRGGWSAIAEYFGATVQQVAFVSLAGVAAAAAVYMLHR